MMTKLPCQNEIAVRVERKLNSFMKQHELDVKLNYYLHREYSEKMDNPPKEKTVLWY